MTRATLLATLAGALLLGAGCGAEEPIAPEPFPGVSPTVYVDPSPETTRVTGFAWDPEAFFFSWATCGATACPISPVLSDQSPLFRRSILQNAPVTLLDPVTSAPAVTPTTTGSSPTGTFILDGVPSRASPPYFTFSVGTGAALPTTQPPGTPPTLPPIPTGNYLPTVNVRPIPTKYSICVFQEALHISDVGILDAVARYRSVVEGRPTTVADFVNPEKYAGVTVFWMFANAFPIIRAPASNTTVTASSGSVYHVAWSPPRPEIPAAIQSPRWYFVQGGSPTSGLGITVILHTAGSAPPAVTYTPTDPVTDAAARRPYKFSTLTLPVIPGVITFAAFQFGPNVTPPFNPNEAAPADHLCLP
jgi:hypothetical protein